MLQSLKQKTLVGKLWAIIVLAVAAIFIGVVFGPGIAKMIAGPTHFAPLDDHDVLSLQGQYLEADIDTLIDYYAETVVSESGRPDKVSAIIPKSVRSRSTARARRGCSWHSEAATATRPAGSWRCSSASADCGTRISTTCVSSRTIRW